MTVKGLKDIPANDWLALKVYDVEHAWSRLAAGNRTIAAFEEFCGAIRFSMFEYRAHIRRNSRVSFDETAAKLVVAAKKVVSLIDKTKVPARDRKRLAQVRDAIDAHRKDILEVMPDAAPAGR